jgi:glycosyltransferase involved in cell wall biosynthesis
MRPVTVIVPLPPSYRGGTEEYAYRVVEETSRSLPIRLLTTNVRWGHDAHSLSVGSAELVVLPAMEAFERPLVLSRRARATLRSAVRDSSLVHLHMPFPTVERSVVAWARRASVPVLLTYHMDATLPSSRVGALTTRLYRRFSARPALAGANLVVSNSRGYSAASPVLSGFLGKVRVVPKGVDPVRLGVGERGPVDSAQIGIPADSVKNGEPRVVFVGRLVAYKGLPILLQAIRRLSTENFRVHLYVAGRGPEEAGLRGLAAEFGIADLVTFLGFVPDDRIGGLYRWADVVACPSVSTMESTPTSLEEAATLGTPVLGSDLPGAAESIPADGVRGLLVEPGNAEAVAAGLRQLVTAGHREPNRIRTWADVVRDYLELYASLVPEISRPALAGPK